MVVPQRPEHPCALVDQAVWGRTSPATLIRYRNELNRSNTFQAGHRIRLDITSSNFPRWGRNLTTGNSGVETAQMVIAHQTIYHDKEHPSVLHLVHVPPSTIKPKVPLTLIAKARGPG